MHHQAGGEIQNRPKEFRGRQNLSRLCVESGFLSHLCRTAEFRERNSRDIVKCKKKVSSCRCLIRKGDGENSRKQAQQSPRPEKSATIVKSQCKAKNSPSQPVNLRLKRLEISSVSSNFLAQCSWAETDCVNYLRAGWTQRERCYFSILRATYFRMPPCL